MSEPLNGDEITEDFDIKLISFIDSVLTPVGWTRGTTKPERDKRVLAATLHEQINMYLIDKYGKHWE